MFTQGVHLFNCSTLTQGAGVQANSAEPNHVLWLKICDAILYTLCYLIQFILPDTLFIILYCLDMPGRTRIPNSSSK